MKIIKILGGLGNQMFQYALYISLKEQFPREQVMIDTSCFKGYPLHNGFEIDRIFSQNAPVASWRDILKVAYPYPNYRFWQIGKYLLPQRKAMCVERKDFTFDTTALTRKGSCYYDGYWQHEEYFFGRERKYLESILLSGCIEQTKQGNSVTAPDEQQCFIAYPPWGLHQPPAVSGHL